MDFGIKDKVALVMGGSTGLGRGIAESLLAEGVKVAICARTKETLEKSSKEMGAHLAIPCDLSQPGASVELIKQVSKELGPIDILVTNTGGPPKGSFFDLSNEHWQQGFQSLWLSAGEAIREVVPHMRDKNFGRILLVTSAAAKEPMAKLTVSNGLRAGLTGLAKSISQEIAQDGITVNCLLPGYTATDRLKELGVDLKKVAESIPAKRLGQPEELGALAAFLSSRQASYITGQAIAVDGGYLKGH